MDSSGGSAAGGGSSFTELAAQAAQHDWDSDGASSSVVRLAPKTVLKSVNVSEHSKLFVITTEPHAVFRNVALVCFGAVATMIIQLVCETRP